MFLTLAGPVAARMEGKSVIGFQDMSSSSVSAPVREITIAHSPDSDDAFMFYALATNKVRVPGLKFSHTLTDIETLNRKAMEASMT